MWKSLVLLLDSIIFNAEFPNFQCGILVVLMWNSLCLNGIFIINILLIFNVDISNLY